MSHPVPRSAICVESPPAWLPRWALPVAFSSANKSTHAMRINAPGAIARAAVRFVMRSRAASSLAPMNGSTTTKSGPQNRNAWNGRVPGTVISLFDTTAPMPSAWELPQIETRNGRYATTASNSSGTANEPACTNRSTVIARTLV